jgi:hypothetical protein
LNCRVDAAVEIYDRIVSPKPALDLLARDNRSLPFKEHQQYLKHLLSQDSRLTGIGCLCRAEFAAGGIKLKGAKSNPSQGRRRGGIVRGELRKHGH